MIITDEERRLAHTGLLEAMELGMSGARVTLDKSVSDTISMLDGEVDKVSHCADRSLTFCLFADGRYGTFSTNRLSVGSVQKFVRKACETVRIMESDPCRTLPGKERLAKDAVTGLEAGLWDSRYMDMSDEKRIELARSMTLREKSGDGWEVVSVESEYTDYVDESFLIDSQRFEGRHCETGFSCSSEVTVTDAHGRRFSSYWWDSSAFLSGIHPESCAETALRKAVESLNPETLPGGCYRMVVDGNVGSKLLSPLINALNAASIQQKMSFLCDSLGKRVFPEGLTLTDMAREKGKAGARFFDSEGVATGNLPLVRKGVVENYFVNTYMANKTGLKPTVEDISRPVLGRWLSGELRSLLGGEAADGADPAGKESRSCGNGLDSDEKKLTLKDILRVCGDGIYVTEFNGGNCNPVTGDYSFGVSGFRFENGEIGKPFREMLITGNIPQLWNSLLAVGDDARECGRWRIPTTAFDGVSFSA